MSIKESTEKAVSSSQHQSPHGKQALKEKNAINYVPVLFSFFYIHSQFLVIIALYHQIISYISYTTFHTLADQNINNLKGP